MLWLKSFHIIFIVTWFSGLFYLPRLFVYHADSRDEISQARFKIMERKLYNGIILPSSVIATVLGIGLLSVNFSGYLHAFFMQAKLALVVLLWIYQFICAKYLRDFRHDRNQHSALFYRWFNEVPVVFLVGIVILVVVKP